VHRVQAGIGTLIEGPWFRVDDYNLKKVVVRVAGIDTGAEPVATALVTAEVRDMVPFFRWTLTVHTVHRRKITLSNTAETLAAAKSAAATNLDELL
jgi:hypothetical protein